MPKEWATTYPTTQDADPITGAQPQLYDHAPPTYVDATRVTQAHALRDKLHALAKTVGDASRLPVGSLAARVRAAEITVAAGPAWPSVSPLLEGSQPVIDTATGQLSFGVADEFPGSALDAAWTGYPSTAGTITVTGGYVELYTDNSSQATLISRPVVPGAYFEAWVHGEFQAFGAGDQQRMLVTDAGNFPLGRAVEIATAKAPAGTDEFWANATGITNYLAAGGVTVSACWLLIRYDGAFLTWGYSNAAHTSEPDPAYGWTYRHSQAWTLPFSPRYVMLAADSASGGDSKARTRFRHFRLRYL